MAITPVGIYNNSRLSRTSNSALSIFEQLDDIFSKDGNSVDYTCILKSKW